MKKQKLIKSLENKIKNLEIINKNLVKENQDKDAKIFALNKKMNELIKQNESLSSKKRIAEIRQFIPKTEMVNNIIIDEAEDINESRATEDREYASLEMIKDNYPKYVATTDYLLQKRNGITHINLLEFMKEHKKF